MRQIDFFNLPTISRTPCPPLTPSRKAFPFDTRTLAMTRHTRTQSQNRKAPSGEIEQEKNRGDKRTHSNKYGILIKKKEKKTENREQSKMKSLKTHETVPVSVSLVHTKKSPTSRPTSSLTKKKKNSPLHSSHRIKT